ncbi:hypothetical protein HDV00_002316 [Rhizophlyctis rosea]|nr:hypothetical protein HDV00_002316 [Rhizophlyctis rosea]
MSALKSDILSLPEDDAITSQIEAKLQKYTLLFDRKAKRLQRLEDILLYPRDPSKNAELDVGDSKPEWTGSRGLSLLNVVVGDILTWSPKIRGCPS